MAKRQLVKATPSGSAKLYDDGVILLSNVRASRVFLRKARDYKGDGNFKYQLQPLLDKGNPGHMEAVDLLKDHIKKLIAEAKFGKVPAKNKFLVDADMQAQREEQDAEFPNHWYCNCKESPEDAPLLYDRAGVNIGRDPQGVIYPGCYVDVIIRPYANDGYGERVSCGISSVRFRRDGDPLGRARARDGDFDDVWDDDDDGGDGAARTSGSKAAVDDEF